MATTTIATPPTLAPSIQATLRMLHGRIQAYIWTEGIALAICWLGAAFWASLAIDWFFEPPREVRVILLLAVVAGLIGVVARTIGARAFVSWRHSSLATVLERRFGTLNDSLLTAVLLAEREIDPNQCSVEMLARTCREAAQRVGALQIGEVFNPQPLRRAVGGAALLTASIVLFAVILPEAFGIWASRAIGMSDELWPRKTHLVRPLAGFTDNVAKVARGGDLTVTVLADLDWPVVPAKCEIRYRVVGGARNRVAMDRQGDADRAKHKHQTYTYTFQNILADVQLEVIGGDDRITGLTIKAVDSPEMESLKLDLVYPPYTRKPDRTLATTATMQIPLGTNLTLHGTATKPLARLRIDTSRNGANATTAEVPVADPAKGIQSFTHELGTLEADTTLVISLEDTDGIRGRAPVRVTLSAVLDEAPQLALQLDGIDSVVTSKAILPLAGRVTDDYGVARLWMEVGVDAAAPTEHVLKVLTDAPTEMVLKGDVAFDLSPLELEPKQKLAIVVKAADRHDLGGKGANVGTTARWPLEVVTPERLRAILEARELSLRQRFEEILREATESREAILKINFRQRAEPKAAGGDKKDEKEEELPEKLKEDEKTMSLERHQALQSMRVQRALQNARKHAPETAGVADSFDDIRKQFVNNRIDTPELLMRLEGGIVQPLRKVADDLLPTLQQRVVKLQDVLSDPARGPSAREEARQQADKVVLAMEEILSRMLELEDFNEAVELLRQIIESQKALEEELKKQKARELIGG